MAQSRLNMLPPNAGSPQQGYPGAQPGTGQPGWAQEPQPGTGQQPGWAQQPQPGWAQEPAQGQTPGQGSWGGNRSRSYDSSSIGDGILSSIEDDIAGAALGAAARFIGRRIGRKVQNTLSEKVMPAVAANQQETLRRQVEIAQRHPDLCACMTDQVVFLAGGSRVLPMKNLNMQMTVAESDALVAQLRG
jgi:hypothetical protein